MIPRTSPTRNTRESTGCPSVIIGILARAFLLANSAAGFTLSRPTRRQTFVPVSSLFASLKFEANIIAESELLEGTVLEKYFATKDFRLHCLSSGGTSQLQESSWDDQLSSCFRQLYEDDGPLPESVHAVDTTIQFPGLEMRNTVTIASRFDQDSNFYENFLIAEEKKAVGAKPLVYVYNKLVRPKSGRTKPSGTAYTKMMKTPSTIVADSKVSIKVDFADWLIRILPVTPQKMQEQGSLSVQKAVGKDIDKFMSSLASSMVEWQRKQDQVVQ